MKFKLGLITVVIAAVILTSVLIAAEEKVSVKPSELPAAIKKAIDQAFPNGKIAEIEKEVKGENPGQYDIIVESGGDKSFGQGFAAEMTALLVIDAPRTAGGEVAHGIGNFEIEPGPMAVTDAFANYFQELNRLGDALEHR